MSQLYGEVNASNEKGIYATIYCLGCGYEREERDEYNELPKPNNTRGKRSLTHCYDDFCNEEEMYKMLEKYIEK